MADLIIEHPDGRRLGTTSAGWSKLKSTDYAGFKIVGEETPADFEVTGIPRKRTGSARTKAKKPAVVKAPVEAPEAPAE